MSEWDNPIEKKWVEPKKRIFDDMCKEIYTYGYLQGIEDARKELLNE